MNNTPINALCKSMWCCVKPNFSLTVAFYIPRLLQETESHELTRVVKCSKIVDRLHRCVILKPFCLVVYNFIHATDVRLELYTLTCCIQSIVLKAAGISGKLIFRSGMLL